MLANPKRSNSSSAHRITKLSEQMFSKARNDNLDGVNFAPSNGTRDLRISNLSLLRKLRITYLLSMGIKQKMTKERG